MSLAGPGLPVRRHLRCGPWKGPNSGAERRGLGDIPGKQHIDGVDWMLADTGEDVAQIWARETEAKSLSALIRIALAASLRGEPAGALAPNEQIPNLSYTSIMRA